MLFSLCWSSGLSIFIIQLPHEPLFGVITNDRSQTPWVDCSKQTRQKI